MKSEPILGGSVLGVPSIPSMSGVPSVSMPEQHANASPFQTTKFSTPGILRGIASMPSTAHNSFMYTPKQQKPLYCLGNQPPPDQIIGSSLLNARAPTKMPCARSVSMDPKFGVPSIFPRANAIHIQKQPLLLASRGSVGSTPTRTSCRSSFIEKKSNVSMCPRPVRRRRKSSELSRTFICPHEGCVHRYEARRSLVQHLRCKHKGVGVSWDSKLSGEENSKDRQVSVTEAQNECRNDNNGHVGKAESGAQSKTVVSRHCCNPQNCDRTTITTQIQSPLESSDDGTNCPADNTVSDFGIVDQFDTDQMLFPLLNDGCTNRGTSGYPLPYDFTLATSSQIPFWNLPLLIHSIPDIEKNKDNSSFPSPCLPNSVELGVSSTQTLDAGIEDNGACN
eukprot:CFRG2079T1